MRGNDSNSALKHPKGTVLVKLVGVDLGTSGVRYECYDTCGNVLSAGRASIKEQTVKEWIRALKLAVPRKKGFEDSDEVLLSVQSTSGTALLVDERGETLFPPLMYYERASEESKKLQSLDSAVNLSTRGVAISATSPMPKVIRMRDKNPEQFAHVKWIISPTVWLLYRLAEPEGEKWGAPETDWTNALKFGADPTGERPSWFEPFFDDVGIPMTLLPRIVPCGKELGVARSKLAEKMGLKNARLFHGMTDGNASALAVGCLKEGDFGFSSGTATAVKYVSSIMLPHRAIYYHKHPMKGFLAGAAPMGAGALDWFAQKIVGVSTTKAVELAGAVEPGEEGVFFPQGDKSPFDDPSLGASLSKIWPEDKSKDKARGKMFRSIIVGLTFFEYYYVALFQSLFKRRIEEAKITGGGTRSPWWNSLRASIYGIPVTVMDERPGIGALIPAVLSLRLFKNLEEAQASLLRIKSVHQPNKTLGSMYEELRDTFLSRWERMRDASSTGDDVRKPMKTLPHNVV